MKSIESKGFKVLLDVLFWKKKTGGDFVHSRFSLNKNVSNMMSVVTRITSNGAKLFSRGCCLAVINYTAVDHPRHFGWRGAVRGSGLLICSVCVCGGKHCMIYQSLETACMTASGCPLSRAAANAGWRGLHLHEWGHMEAGKPQWSHVWLAGRDSSLGETRLHLHPLLPRLTIFSISLALLLPAARSRLLALIPVARDVAQR